MIIKLQSSKMILNFVIQFYIHYRSNIYSNDICRLFYLALLNKIKSHEKFIENSLKLKKKTIKFIDNRLSQNPLSFVVEKCNLKIHQSIIR